MPTFSSLGVVKWVRTAVRDTPIGAHLDIFMQPTFFRFQTAASPVAYTTYLFSIASTIFTTAPLSASAATVTTPQTYVNTMILVKTQISDGLTLSEGQFVMSFTTSIMYQLTEWRMQTDPWEGATDSIYIIASVRTITATLNSGQGDFHRDYYQGVFFKIAGSTMNLLAYKYFQ
jgi:hypothetical protein